MQINQKIGSWTIKTLDGSKMLCVCDCGTQRSVLTRSLIEGTSRSCGCLKVLNHRKVMASTFPRQEALDVVC